MDTVRPHLVDPGSRRSSASDGSPRAPRRSGIEHRGPLTLFTLCDPERLNPLGEDIRQDLEMLIDELADSEEARVVVLRGEGRAFSAGADLDPAGQEAIRGVSWARRRRILGAWQRTLASFESLPQVTVASLHGWTVGGAALLAAACDIRIAADTLRVSIPELHLGIPLTWAGLPRLVREIGLPRTRDLVMTGRVVDASEALSWGYVTRVVAPESLDVETDALIESLLAMPAAPLAMTRDALSAIGRASVNTETAWSDPDLLAWSLLEPEGREAAAAYRARHRNGRGARSKLDSKGGPTG